MRTYTVQEMSLLPPTTNRSTQYWRREAARLLVEYPKARVVICRQRNEAIAAGLLRRGAQAATHPLDFLIIASKSGQYGHSREDLRGIGLTPVTTAGAA